jgi:diaminohydroxyphosphoribosylaminopyrimidine deaminase/5-amino-6-(5-phosphoribosylamino)uracil reductase
MPARAACSRDQARVTVNIDQDFMQRCFQLAERGRHTCRPNPVVGCVIAHGDRVVGEGWHAVAGQGHAEVVALQQAGEAARAATVYVSLEPCAHQGRTGPCAEALVRAGVAEVVYGMQDPNPLVAGKGLGILQAAGIRVRGPLLQAEAEQLNPGFNQRMRLGRPWLRCKVGMSLDGRTAMASGESQWITGPESRADVQQWRARSCAILTGSGTVLADDPQLNVRLPDYRGPQPLRVVVDSQGRVPATARLCTDGGPLLLATGKDFPGADGRVDLAALLRHLAAERHCNEVLVEAGPALTGALLQAGLVDELLLYVAPSLLGHEARPLAWLPGLQQLSQRLQLEFRDVAMLGKDCRIRALPTPAPAPGAPRG